MATKSSLPSYNAMSRVKQIIQNKQGMSVAELPTYNSMKGGGQNEIYFNNL